MKALLRLLFVLAWSCAALVAVAAEEDYQRALKLVQQGQTKSAQLPLDAYIKELPQDVRARFLQGVILVQTGKLAEATRLYQDLIEEFPQFPEPFNNLAVLYGMQGQYDKARAVLEMALHTHPSYAIAYENLGDVYSRMASQAYEKALQLDKQKPVGQPNLKLINELRGVDEPVRVAVSKPPEAIKPTPVITTVESKPLQPAVEEALKAVSDWAAAWSRNDVEGYVAAYVPTYQPSEDVSHELWVSQRQARIAKPRKIAVSVMQPSVRPLDDGRMQVSFRQQYRSGKLEEVGNKTLILVKSADRWLILQERTGN